MHDITCITRGVILDINNFEKLCYVDIPILRNSASPITPTRIEAAMCIVPGLFNNLMVGDKVFIAFDEHKWERPLILGKLFIDTNEEASRAVGKEAIGELHVKNKTVLSGETVFSQVSPFAKNSSLASSDLKFDKLNVHYLTQNGESQTEAHESIKFSNFYNALDYILSVDELRLRDFTSYTPLKHIVLELQEYYTDWLTMYKAYVDKNGTGVLNIPKEATVNAFEGLNVSNVSTETFTLKDCKELLQDYSVLDLQIKANPLNPANKADLKQLKADFQTLSQEVEIFYNYFDDVLEFLRELTADNPKAMLLKYGRTKYYTQLGQLKTDFLQLYERVKNLKNNLLVKVAKLIEKL